MKTLPFNSFDLELEDGCEFRPDHDPVTDRPTGPKCGNDATHVIFWLDGSNRYSPACEEHLKLDHAAMPHRVERVIPL